MTADIKPVAWVSNRDPMFGDGWGATSPIVYSDPGAHAAPSGELAPLYPQSAIDSLQVMLDGAHADFKEMERLAHMHKARAERAEAEVEALRVRADAMAGEAIKHEARAERLEEALREIERLMPDQAGPAWIAKTIASAALHDHDQEGK